MKSVYKETHNDVITYLSMLGCSVHDQAYVEVKVAVVAKTGMPLFRDVRVLLWEMFPINSD